MLATRPAPTTTEAETASSAQEEKNIHENGRDALRDERKPLLDLDDVAQFESELAACFDAPPSQPISIRRDRPAPSVAPWPPAASAATSQRVENRYVPRPRLNPSATVAPPPAVSAGVSAGTTTRTQAVGHMSAKEILQQEKLALLQMDMDEVEAEAETDTEGGIGEKAAMETSLMGPSDFSSLYTPHRTALMAESERHETSQSTVEPTAPPTEAVRPGLGAAQQRAAATRSTVVEAAAAAVASRREAGMGTQAARGSSDISVEVVEELLTENEKLRLIIQDMSEEYGRFDWKERKVDVHECGRHPLCEKK